MGAFEPGQALAMMRDHRVTHMFASPSLLAALVRHPAARQHDWGAVRSILVGGAPITDATALLARGVFGDVLFQGFGQTEAVSLAVMGPEEWFADIDGSIPLRAAGRVLPYAQVEIRGPLAPCCRSGQRARSWPRWGARCEATGETTSWAAPDWWRAGYTPRTSVASMPTASSTCVDHVDDRIVSGGFNMWPAELETVIADHPAVVEVAVFAIPDERWGEAPMAVVCVNDPSALTSEEIIEMCHHRLGSYEAKPGGVHHDPLPRSIVGKLLRKQLREPHSSWVQQAWATPGHTRRATVRL